MGLLGVIWAALVVLLCWVNHGLAVLNEELDELMNVCPRCMNIFVDNKTHVCPMPEEQKQTKDLSDYDRRKPETDKPIQHK